MYLVTFMSKLNGVQARRMHHKRLYLWGSRAGNSPSAAIRGRCHGGLREGGWLAYGHWLMRVSHDARGVSNRVGVGARWS
jgi:hypothetical protein